MASVANHPAVIDDYLKKEGELGRVRGPFHRGPGWSSLVQVSPLGVIPKSSPGEWRLIVDMSSPVGRSVNDGINRDVVSLSYVSVDNLAEVVCCLGRGTLLAKFDIKSAYRLVPVYPEDRLLLGLQWREQLYIDTVLPFGLRSAPKLFNAVADALQWIIRSRGPRLVFHYLDDFALVGEPRSEECQGAFQTAREVCEWLEVPWAMEKAAEPATCMTFLGVEFDTQAMQLRLPQQKQHKLEELVLRWCDRTYASKKELQSLAGHLQHACKVVRPGRCFLRRLFELISVAKNPDRFLRLNKAIRCDLQWWRVLLRHWNGTSLMWELRSRDPDIHVYSDAAEGWGCGAVWGKAWLQHEWVGEARPSSIAVMELIPIAMATALWGARWEGKVVCFHSDNEAVVTVLNSLSSKAPELMHLLRCMFLFAALRSVLLVLC